MLDISAPNSLPELHFLGADRLLVPLRQALNSNLSVWDTQCSVRLNLQKVLQIVFLSPQHADKPDAEDYAVECAICYNYRLESNAVPDCACDGCGKPYHGSCLSEWLRGLPSTQQSFTRLFGAKLHPRMQRLQHPLDCYAIVTSVICSQVSVHIAVHP